MGLKENGIVGIRLTAGGLMDRGDMKLCLILNCGWRDSSNQFILLHVKIVLQQYVNCTFPVP